jgi:hypothetical protein
MPTKSELIDEHVSLSQCKKAVDALLKHALQHQSEREETELFPGKEQHIWLQVTVKKMHPERKLKPHKMCVLNYVQFFLTNDTSKAQSSIRLLTRV